MSVNYLRLSPAALSFSDKYHSPQLCFSSGQLLISTKDRRVNLYIREICKSRSISSLHRVIECNATAVDDLGALEVSVSNEIKKLIRIIKSMLGSMGDGELRISAYDTAWVALIKNIDGSDINSPQFPSCLKWIADNQLPHGSWGDDEVFLAHDRLINTLACIVALKSWDAHLDKCEKGISFLRENLWKLENENEEHTTAGFEVAFPSLLEIARGLDIEIPYDSHVLQKVYAMRNFKLKNCDRIPIDKMHSVPTTLLFSLEGMPNMDWEKLLKLQFQDGSFLCSLSSTAYAFMQTKDNNCLKYLTQVVQRFNGGVPFSYPIDLFEQLWVVDRLQRLGISSYFQPELRKCMDHVYSENNVFQDGLPVRKCLLSRMDDSQVEVLEVSASNEIKKLDHIIKSMLGSMDGGEISTSAYDTAWVALIKDIDGNDAPQFPSCLQWIADNQLPDGSWGDDKIFLAHDRLINTLACIVALKSWNVHLDKCEKGISFVKGHLSKLENENEEHTTCGFEVAFPSLLEIARSLDIEIPDHPHVLRNIYAMRNFKLKRIPKEKLHSVPTTLLFSLEGMPELDWEKLMKLQFQNGSFLFSLSSTAYAFMQTQDENCLKYLTQVVRRFNGGVPSSYPMDLFERLWAVDRLQRLGISRYFRSEIKECMDYIYRYWNEKGIFSGRNTRIPDIDDTSMGFRLLRLHGYDVSADVLQYFEEGGEFFCFLGETSQAITPTFSLYRASQVQFPEEKILEKAKQFSARFLREKQAANKLLDKWIMAKDLPGEVSYALDIPWFASLPRIEARFYIKQYGGEDDVWIGKTLYRMKNISNNFYLQLAKLDYNNCQAIHQSEWISMQKWYTKCKLENFGTSKRALLLAYFVASASIYEPERKRERFAWAKAAVLVETIASYFRNQQDSREKRKIFVDEFRNCINPQEGLASNKTEQGFTGTTLRQHIYLSFHPQPAQGRNISHQLLHAWEKWLMKWQAQGDRHQGEAELIVQTINLSAGNCLSEDLLSQQEYKRLMDLTNTICHKLGEYQNQKVHDASDSDVDIDHMQRDFVMQELVQVVLQSSSNGIDFEVKQTFLTVTKSFYYSAYCDSKTINFHIDKVLFERVE